MQLLIDQAHQHLDRFPPKVAALPADERMKWLDSEAAVLHIPKGRTRRKMRRVLKSLVDGLIDGERARNKDAEREEACRSAARAFACSDPWAVVCSSHSIQSGHIETKRAGLQHQCDRDGVYPLFVERVIRHNGHEVATVQVQYARTCRCGRVEQGRTTFGKVCSDCQVEANEEARYRLAGLLGFDPFK